MGWVQTWANTGPYGPGHSWAHMDPHQCPFSRGRTAMCAPWARQKVVPPTRGAFPHMIQIWLVVLLSLVFVYVLYVYIRFCFVMLRYVFVFFRSDQVSTTQRPLYLIVSDAVQL